MRKFLKTVLLVLTFSFFGGLAYSGTSDISKKQLLDYFSTEIALLKLPLSFDILWSSYGKFSIKSANDTEEGLEFTIIFLKRHLRYL